jgi:hypothetical protein
LGNLNYKPQRPFKYSTIVILDEHYPGYGSGGQDYRILRGWSRERYCFLEVSVPEGQGLVVELVLLAVIAVLGSVTN